MSTLKVVDELKVSGKQYKLASCTNCGALKIVKKANELDECEICKKINKKYDDNDIKNEYISIKNNAKQLKSNQYFKDEHLENRTTTAIGEQGIIEERGKVKLYHATRKYMLCKKCNKLRVIKNTEGKYELDNFNFGENLPTEYDCPYCKAQTIENNNNRVKKDWKQLKGASEILKKRENIENTGDELYKKELDNVDDTKEFSDSQVSKYRGIIHKYNSNLEFAGDVFIRNGIKVVKVYCKTCGTPRELEVHNKQDIINYECNGCKIKKTVDPLYNGIYNRNLVGTVINNMICYEDNGDKVLLHCHMCKKEKTVDKYKFINHKVFCTCEHSEVEYDCTRCGAPISTPISEIISNRYRLDTKLTCKHCGKEYLAKEAIFEKDAMDKRIETKINLDETYSKLRAEFDNIDDELAVSRDIAYYGVHSGKIYRNCRCLKHHQNMVLNEDEIITYHLKHFMCNRENDKLIHGSIQSLIHNDEVNTKELDELRKLKLK